MFFFNNDETSDEHFYKIILHVLIVKYNVLLLDAKNIANILVKVLSSDVVHIITSKIENKKYTYKLICNECSLSQVMAKNIETNITHTLKDIIDILATADALDVDEYESL